MYKCIECGHIFDESEIAVWSESRGEYWGMPCSESVSGCPKCRGDYEKVVECDCCGEYFFEEDIEDGLCIYCFNIKNNDEEVNNDEDSKG